MRLPAAPTVSIWPAFGAPEGGSFEVERAESSAKRMSASVFTEPSVPMDSATSVSPRWIASTPSWIADAPDAQAVDSAMGEPLVPSFSASRSVVPR